MLDANEFIHALLELRALPASVPVRGTAAHDRRAFCPHAVAALGENINQN